MKKLLILALVLALAPLVSASVVDIGYLTSDGAMSIASIEKGVQADGTWAAGTYDLVVTVSDTIKGFDATIVATGDVTLVGSGAMVNPGINMYMPAATGLAATYNTAQVMGMFDASGATTVGILAALMSAGDTVGTLGLDTIVAYQFQAIVGADGGSIGFAPYSNPDAAIRLASGDYSYDAANFGALSFEVASVPEPMTMALLGLGGLVIRRKKK